MKTILISILLVILICVITGCDKRSLNVPTNPDEVSSSDADRVLAFRYYANLSDGDYYGITMYSTSRTSKDISDDVVELAIGDSIIPLIYQSFLPYEQGWYAPGIHLLADVQSIVLRINGATILSTSIKPVNRASAAFPSQYNYQQPLTLNWAVSSGNQYQFVKVESWSNIDVGNPNPFDQYVKQTGPFIRSYTFPANCVAVADSLSLTTFVLAVQEINYRIAGKTALMVYQEESQAYTGSGTSDYRNPYIANPLKLNKVLSRRL